MPVYNDQLTPQESQAGFIRAYVSDPNHVYDGHGSIIPAVILPVRPGVRFLKLTNPSGGCSYVVQAYATYSFGSLEDAHWIPVVSGMPTVELAIAAARRGPEIKFKPAPSKLNDHLLKQVGWRSN